MISGNSVHDEKTTPQVFSGIVNILTALIRHRRDLVADSLPHLSHILCRCLGCLRTVRPRLGAKQRRSVTDTLPSWVQPNSPLGADEAKALARVLTGIANKVNIQIRNEPARSLAPAFSKHAPYVLCAYLNALTDPLSVYETDVRKELEPGLFSLCGMMGEYGRDSIMASALDGSGQTMLKLLWAEYDKQKYVGKG